MNYAIGPNWDSASLHLVKDVSSQTSSPKGPLPWFPNDVAARAGGIADWEFYLNSSGVQQLQGV